ncbi:protein dopey-1 homolog [Clonorchis sinensis]|uniref:Protein dopey-1 homolog n=1 Tax=Clonorchis sinensis TaxID=79923 RepID=G7YJG1_CLOSI|nr:protein dopey-1 homolog [Clonorchis sinensis]
MNTEEALENHAKFRSFTAQVDKSLKGFEYSTEWADLISALGRLIKVIQSNSKAGYIPRGFLIGKRLAQCLHPALPPGVHCKALECYDAIFRTVGPQRLVPDLPIYGAGLFSLLGPSAMAVKPPLFDIFQEHLLPLGTALQPAFMGLLQGLLPGLEQGAEFSERGVKTVEMFCAAVGPKFFYTCLWKILIHSPPARHFGISFALNHFNKRKPLEDQDYIYGLNRRVLIQSLSRLFGDSVLLVQRDALDFLLMALPIHFISLPNVNVADGPLSKEDCKALCTSALCVLLRRDASLNRRLFTWLKGGQPVEVVPYHSSTAVQNSHRPLTMAYSVLSHCKEVHDFMTTHDQATELDQYVQSLYFNRYSKAILIDAVRQIIRRPTCLPLPNQLIGLWDSGSLTAKRASSNIAIERGIAERPYRILTGLLDRCDLGVSIIETVLSDILRYTYDGFHVLKQRSSAWIGSDSTKILHPKPPTNCGFDTISAIADSDVVTMIMNHVLAKDNTKSLSLRIEAQSKKLSLPCTGEVLAPEPEFSEMVRTEETNMLQSFDAATTGHRSGACGSVPTYRLTASDEFLRTAHLFLSNLDGSFLWEYIETEFSLLLATRTTTGASHVQQLRPHFQLDNLCRVVHFLVTKLPIDTYPGVRNYHLPRLTSHLLTCMMQKIQATADADEGSLSPAHVSSLLSVVDCLVSQMFEFIMSMFDKATIFSVNDPKLSDPKSETSPDISKGPNVSRSLEPNLAAVATTIGHFRQLFGIFCVHILEFSPQQMRCILRTSRNSKYPVKPDIDQTSVIGLRNSNISNRPVWLEVFTQMCRLLLRLSEFPLLISASECSQHGSSSICGPSELMQLFCGDLTSSSRNSNENILPEWFTCLLYASTEVENFDMKSIALYTLLELLFASASIHGWMEGGEVNPVGSQDSHPLLNAYSLSDKANQAPRMRLILPVLSGRLLTYVVRHTDTFQHLGVSLWHYLSQSHAAYHEDVANLFLRLHQIAPPTSNASHVNSAPGCPIGGISSNVEAFILSQMLSTDLHTQVDAQQRFALLWHLMRPSPGSSSVTRTVPGRESKLAAFSSSIAAPCWRLQYMGSYEFANVSVGRKRHSFSHPFIPFYRCVLLLLDHLDIDIPWGPMGPVGAVGFNSALSYLPNGYVNSDSIACNISEAGSAGLVRSVLRDQAVHWAVRALRTGQVDRLMAPILAALLHPATVRISLKARVILDNQYLLNGKKNGMRQSKSNQQESTETLDFTLAADEESASSKEFTVNHQLQVSEQDVFGPTYRTMDMLSVLQTKLRSINSGSTKQETGFDTTEHRATTQTYVTGDNASTMLPLHEHLVIYLQNHDANQVVYALSRLRALLSLAPTVFVSSLLVCPVTGGSASDPTASPTIYLFGISLVELLARHRRALAGGNFYASATQVELNRVIHAQPTLLEVVVNLCILIMCSQLPCTGECPISSRDSSSGVCESRYRFTESEFRANKYAQKAAAEVLELIVKELVNISNYSGFEAYLIDSSQLLPPGRQGSNAGQHSNGRLEDGTSGPKFPTTAGRRLIDAISIRTCLTSAIFHCLASAVEIAHWPGSPSNWLSSLSSTEASSLPTCLRLLLVNEVSSGLPDSFHTAYLCSLIRLTQSVLELNPWSLDHHAPSSGSQTSHPSTVWTSASNACSTAQAAQNYPGDLDSSVLSKFRPDQLLKIWLDAFSGLPRSLVNEPLFRTACLSVHWNSVFIPSRSSCREEGALLCDVLSLALSPPKAYAGSLSGRGLSCRRDLHPVWYQFIFATLASWNAYTPYLLRVAVEQICSNLSALTDQCFLSESDYRQSSAYYSKEHLSLPGDYTLASLACLQGIYSALLLPGGSATSAAWFRKISHQPRVTVSGPTASQLAGFPDSIAKSAELAETLAELTRNDANIISTTTRGLSAADQSISSVARYDPLFPSPLASGGGAQTTASPSSSSQGLSSEPSVILTPSVAENGTESKTNVQHFAAIFTSRTKDLFGQSNFPNPDAHPLVQAQAELFRLLPFVLTSLASIWEAFNRHSSGNSFVTDSSQSPELPWPVMPAVPVTRLPAFTALGTPTSVRSAIWMLLEPIALHHPASFLITMALAWPPNLVYSHSGTTAGSKRGGILSLLTPSYSEVPNENEGPNYLPLLPEQVSLLRIFSGYVFDQPPFGLLLPVSTFIDKLRDLVRQPLTNVALLAHLEQANSTGVLMGSQNTVGSSANVISSTKKQNRAELRVRIQVNLLHLLYAWLINEPRSITPNLLLILLRDLISIPVDTSSSGASGIGSSVSLPPAAVFLLVKIFNVFIQLNGKTEDRREQRELQELCHRILESTTAVAASSLEQPSWFRRTLQVRQPDARGSSSPVPPPPPVPATSENDLSKMNHSSSSSTERDNLCNSRSATNLVTTECDSPAANPRFSRIDAGVEYKTETVPCSSTMLMNEGIQSKDDGDLAVQAMELLAEHMASLLDFVYKSDEKDRIPAFLASILSSIFPYLRVRMPSNSQHFTAASKLLASVSSFQYTRRAWRREVLDLFFEPVFFQMNAFALQSWNLIIDNLMTQDKSTFKEVLMRLTFSQSGTLNLFSNREAEHDLRAAYLKKLSYLIYASDVDQYAKAMPELLERLAECLRLGQGIVPQVHAQVFVFARTLISRMSPIQLTSLWPIVIPELILVFKSLVKHVESNRVPSADRQKSLNSQLSNEPSSKEMCMYLSACKFLATGLLCSGDEAPQFSFYQWIFVNETGEYEQHEQQNETAVQRAHFTPLIVSVTESLRHLEVNRPLQRGKFDGSLMEPVQGCLHILAVRWLTDFSQLSPFLYSLNGKTDTLGASVREDGSDLLVHLALEASLAQEFPEPVVAR